MITLINLWINRIEEYVKQIMSRMLKGKTRHD